MPISILSRIFRVNMFLNILFLFLGLAIIPQYSFAQNEGEKVGGENVLISNGIVVDTLGKKLEGVTVKLYELLRNAEGEETYEFLDKSSTSKKTGGIISITLDFNKEYVLIFSKKGYLRKKVWFDTKIKPTQEDQYIFEYTIVLTDKSPSALDPQILDKPVVKISFKPTANDFGYDSLYLSNLKDQLRGIRPDLKDRMLKSLRTENDSIIDREGKLAAREIKIEEDKYKPIIAKADAASLAGNLEEAIQLYNEAQVMMPTNPYPGEQIEEIKKRLQSKEKYDAAIDKADKLFAESKFNEAKPVYAEALKYKKDDEKATKRVAECNDQLYKQTIAKADQLFNEKKYPEAKGVYIAARDFKENDPYVAGRINEIENIVHGDEIQAQYNAKLSQAEGALTVAKGKAQKDPIEAKKAFNEARELFVDAAKIKPSEKTAKDRIAEIDKSIVEIEKTIDGDKEYTDLISQADLQFNLGNNMPAKKLYAEASKRKPSDNYPKEKIKAIDKVIADVERKAATENEYVALVNKADNHFDHKDYETAKGIYIKASSMRPDDPKPKERLAAIIKLKAEVAQVIKKEDDYAAIIAKADAALDKNNFKLALELFKSAQPLKPNDDYPASMIEIINNILSGKEEMPKIGGVGTGGDPGNADSQNNNPNATPDAIAKAKEEAEKTVRYTTAITSGDNSYKKKAYDDAIIEYSKALKEKPNEVYPADMIQKTKELIGDGKSKPVAQTITKLRTDIDPAREREVKEAREALQKQIVLFEKTKQGNLSTKYETKNPLTTLYDQVDAYHAAQKNKPINK